MSETRQEQEELERKITAGEIVRAEPEPLIRIEPGAPPLGEMVPTYFYTCDLDKTTFSSYHSVSTLEQLHDMCPKCNELGQLMTRVQRNTLRNEFAAEFVLCHTGDVRFDDWGKAVPIKAGWKWPVFRVPLSVRKKYFGLFGPLVIRIGLDAGDRQIMGHEKLVENQPADAKAQYEGTSILMTYLLEHGKRVAWSPSEHDPIPAYDSKHKSPYVAEFEYHREVGKSKDLR